MALSLQCLEKIQWFDQNCLQNFIFRKNKIYNNYLL